MILFLFVVALGFGVYACNPGETYAKFTKVTGDNTWQCSEYWRIKSGDQVLFTSPIYVFPQTDIVECCLPNATNSLYTLVLVVEGDSLCNDWDFLSLLTVEGKYNNIVFKGAPIEGVTNTSFPLSFYYGIETNSTWKLTSGIVDGLWTHFNYDDSLWFEETLGNVSLSVAGTQYYRRVFTGVSDMAAYELGMKYQYGIVAYINGREIYRDNMPTGEVTPLVPCSGSYSSLEFHNVIRPGSEVSSAQSILSIELHFEDVSQQNTITFDAFLGIVASTVLQDNCYAYPYPVSIMPSSYFNDQVFDFHTGTTGFYTESELPVSLDYILKGPKAMINAYGIWIGLDAVRTPGSLIIQGKHNTTGAEWVTLRNVTSITSHSYSFSVVKGYFGLDLYTTYRGIISSIVDDTDLYLDELQAMTCSHTVVTSIEFEQDHYSFYLYYKFVHIQPINPIITNCTISPVPPSGLSFDSASCTLSGVMTSTLSLTQFNVTSSDLTGSFSIEVIECAENLILLERIYSLEPNKESFTLKNDKTEEVIMESSVELTPESTHEFVFCIPDGDYSVTTSSSEDRWYANSFLYIHSILDYSQYDTIIRARKESQLDELVFTFSLSSVIRPREEWWYLMGSAPTNWYGSRITGWTIGSAPNYPDSSNILQLYKKFIVIPSLKNVALLIFSVRFNCDFVIYINNQLAFSRGNDTLNLNSYCQTQIYTNSYHQITIPVHTIGTQDHPSIEFVREGNNTIAIGYVSPDDDFKSYFDCSLRLMGSSSRTYTVQSESQLEKLYGDIAKITRDFAGYSIYHTACTSNFLRIIFDGLSHERYEWINSITISLVYQQTTQLVHQFDVYGIRQTTNKLELIKEVRNLTWGSTSQHIWLSPSYPYKQIQLRDFSTGDPSSCAWKIGNIQLWNRYIDVNPPPLSYPSQLVFRKNQQIEDVYPNSDMYYDFSIRPVLPQGLLFNSDTGVISGTPVDVVFPITYTVTARNFNGASVSCSFTLSVGTCQQNESLITVTVYVKVYSVVNYTIYQGRGVTSNVIDSVTDFPLKDEPNNFSYCLPHNIYTIDFKGVRPDILIEAVSYSLSVDDGEFRYHAGNLYVSRNRMETTTWNTHVFSSYLPFQMDTTEWKVYKGNTLVRENWRDVNFNDSSWDSLKGSRVGTSDAITLYARRSFDIADISEYHVLNIRVKYLGGLAAYFNGNLVAMFNLEYFHDSFTEGEKRSNTTSYSVFHVILPYTGGRTGKNVMGFEVHRPEGQSTKEPFVFDATGVFGVNDCSIVLDTVTWVAGPYITGSNPLDVLFDMNPFTVTKQPYNAASVDWKIGNEEGTTFNTFGVLSNESIDEWGFRLRGLEDNASYDTILNVTDQYLNYRGEYMFSVPLGTKIWFGMEYVLTHRASYSNFESGEYLLYYCIPPYETSCPSQGVFHSVGNGEVSMVPCPDALSGYQYRLCTNGVFGEIDDSDCYLYVPQLLRYDNSQVTLVVNKNASIPSPHYLGIIDTFYLDDGVSLPDGLVLDERTGAITGIPTSTLVIMTFTINGKNERGSVSTTISLTIRSPQCKEKSYPIVNVGSMIFTKCNVYGDYVGIVVRSCIMGENDGVWSEPYGECIPAVEIRPSLLIYEPSTLMIALDSVVNVTCSLQGGFSVFQVVSGVLPSGLELNMDNGTISGLATSVFDSSSVTIEARNTAGSVNATLTIAVIQPAANLKYSESSFSVVYQDFFSTVPSFVGNEVTFSISFGGLPEGLKLDEKTGVISGTPTEFITNLMCEITCKNVYGSTKATVLFSVRKSRTWITVCIIVVCLIVLLGSLVYVLNKRRKNHLPLLNTRFV